MKRKQIALWLFQAKRHPLHAGVARRAGAAQEDSSDPKPVRIVCRLPPGQQWPGLGDTCIGRGGGPSEKATSQLGLAQVVAEADRVLEDNGTVKETKAVLRRWSSTWAKATKKGLEEDSHRAQVTSWHPGRGGVASRASPQQDSGAEDWLAKSREEVEGFKKAQVSSWAEAVLIDGGLEADDELIQQTVTALQQQGVTGKSLLELTLEQMMQDGIPRGPAVLLTKKIRLLQEPEDDPDATAFIQELVNAKPKDLGEGRQDGVQVFDLKTRLPAEPYDLSGRKLLTRSTTRQAWKATFELMKDGTRRVAMLGIPGIGKSRSLALGLWHLVSGHRPDWIKEPQAIVYEARESLKVFIFTNKDGDWKAQSIALEDWKPGSCEHLQNSDNWYLVDTYGKETTGKLPAKTVKACSPVREHYTDFVKSGGACVYVEAWKKAELELAYVHFAQPPVDKDTVLRRFQYVGGNLRALLDDDGSFQKYLQDQKDQADDWKGLQPAFGDVLDSRGNKLLTRLFTYVTVDGKIGTAQVVSPKAAEVIADKHYDKLADLWTKNDPRSRYWFEDFLGPLLTCSWFPKKFDAYHITDKNSIGKANWERTLCDSLVIDAGLQLLRCDTKDIFERKWSQAVKNGSLEKCLLQSPEQYLGVDYLLGLNHGISATTGPKHSIAKSFLEKLRDIFQHYKGQYSFTLSFFTTGDPAKFAPESGQEFRAFMEMARGPNKVFKNVHVQVVQVPKTRNSMEKV
ncbi:unnamed protein product [Effrenium voratum]|nr:unnamed protein product [Effrenium voratum]